MDRNFDDIAQRFERNIYNSAKGQIRLSIVWDDLETILPSDRQASWRVLDAGAGMGQIAARLALRGHHVVLCDISENMLQLAAGHLREQGVSEQVEFRHAAIQELGESGEQPFDLVVLHAVLEWVKEPWQVLQKAVDLVKPGGFFSLLFYNRHSLVLRNVLRGNFRKVKSNDYTGDPGSLTPKHPLLPDEVYQKLQEQGIDIRKCTGVRMFYDYLSREMREQRSLEDILEMEKLFADQEPYRSMARYIHVIGRKQPQNDLA